MLLIQAIRAFLRVPINKKKYELIYIYDSVIYTNVKFKNFF